MNKLLKNSFCVLASLTFLVGCVGSGPSRGYSLRKAEISDFYKNLGGNGDEVKYTSCTYVLVEREGSDNVYFYEAYYTFSANSSSSYSAKEYFAWIEGYSYTEDSSYTAFSLAYDRVKNGYASGEIGTL